MLNFILTESTFLEFTGIHLFFKNSKDSLRYKISFLVSMATSPQYLFYLLCAITVTQKHTRTSTDC